MGLYEFLCEICNASPSFEFCNVSGRSRINSAAAFALVVYCERNFQTRIFLVLQICNLGFC